jgi:hypothetical protein
MLNTFSLAILTQKRRVANNAIEGGFQLYRKLDWVLEVVLYELFEDGEAVIVLKESDMRSALVLSRSL